MAKHDRLIEAAARVKSLRDELKTAEADLERILSGEDDAARSVAKPGSVADRVLNVLRQKPMCTFGVEDLRPLLDDVQASTLRSTVARLARDGIINKAERGRYQAAAAGRPAAAQANGVAEPRMVPAAVAPVAQ